MTRRFQYYTPIFLQKVGYVTFFLLHKLFVGIEIKGKENLQNPKGPIIFAPNHTSELDVTAIPLVLPFFSALYPIYFVSNPTEKFNNFGWRSYIYGGVFFNILGGYSIHSGHKNYAISLEDHVNLLKIGKTVVIFPESMRTPDGKLKPARGGLGYMVYTTGAIVVPISINTFFNMSWKEYFFRRRKVAITVLSPLYLDELITTSDPSAEDFRRAGQIVLDKIVKAL